MDAGAGCSARGAYRDCGVYLPDACCLGVCLSVAAAPNSQSEISERAVAVAGGVHAGVSLASTVLRNSLVRSTT